MTLAALAAIAVAVAAGCGGGEDGSGSGAKSQNAGTGVLFSQTAAGGSLRPTGANTYELALRRPAARVTSFSDRPLRNASGEPLSTFVSEWGARGFASDPPNAALVVDGADEEHDTVVLELSRPRYDGRARVLRYRARRVKGSARLARVAPGQDRAVPKRFGRAELFVDAAGPIKKHYILFQVDVPNNGSAEVQFSNAEFDLSPTNLEVQNLSARGNPGAPRITLSPTTISIGGNAPLTMQIELSVVGGKAPVAGTAKLSPGTNVRPTFDNTVGEPLQNGKFTLK